MKAIILAAGEGKRLRPLTADRPKCMVHYRKKPVLEWIVECMHACSITDILAITGYRAEKIDIPGLRFLRNPRFASTNMVYTLFCAEPELTGDLIVSYSDIIYEPRVLDSLLRAEGRFCIAIDRQWERLWRMRMENPLDDAESLRIDETGNIVEIGEKTDRLDRIQGQYMGLFRISADAIAQVRELYHALDRTATYDGKDFENMYMTSFIREVAARLMPVKAVMIDGGWLEIDSKTDLETYERHDLLSFPFS